MNSIWLIVAVLVLLGCYGGMHYYMYRKLCWIFPRHKRAIIISLSLLAVSLIVVQVLVHAGSSRWLIYLAWLPSLWMGYVFLFFSLAVVTDLLFKAASFVNKGGVAARVPLRVRSITIAGLTIVVCVAGFISAQQINIQIYTLAAAKLKRPVSLVQISDLHLGLLSSEDHLRRQVAKINALHPDIIVSTGDLVDMQSEYLDGFSAALAQLRAPLGKFAVYGNHEVYAGIERARAFTERAGFTVLSNQGVTLEHAINVVGIDDPAVQGKFKVSGVQEKRLLEQFPRELFTLLLKHQPVVVSETRSMVDLQLSGHTHGGQIFPFNLLVKVFYHTPFGLSQTGPASWLYVSKGTGTWGPPMRVLADPEISVFYLRPAAEGQASR
jgi:predicted MPP superfamily phosphohydrolase